MQRVLITGGAGFIGSHVTDTLLEQGHSVRILDSMSPQVHGDTGQRPDYLSRDAELLNGDVRDVEALDRALKNVDAVIHLAAAVGVGQSMYRIADYVGTNDLGTAVLLEALMRQPVGRLVVASSMSVYGEGMTRDLSGAFVEPEERPLAQLERGRWELEGPDGAVLEPVPTPESKRPSLSSVYALGKYSQERMCLIFGRTYQVPTVALRFFNVFGTRQALSNPYTGVLAIFASRLLNNRAPVIFEDGQQRRDFVHVHDVARACLAALHRTEAAGLALNIGSGSSRTVEEVALAMAVAVNKPHLLPEISGRYRAGDIRHCFADTTQAQQALGWSARESFDEGLAELADWLAGMVAIDRVDQATSELERWGLVA